MSFDLKQSTNYNHLKKLFKQFKNYLNCYNALERYERNHPQHFCIILQIYYICTTLYPLKIFDYNFYVKCKKTS